MTCPRASCALCATLAAGGVTTAQAEVCPPEAAALEAFGPPREGYELRRCRDCGALYRYWFHYEYDPTGSWDEYYLWRLEDAAQAPVSALMALPRGRRDAPLAAALRHPSDAAREAAALLAWTWASEGEPLVEAVVAACETLSSASFVAGNFAYRALLAYLRGSPARAARVRAALESSRVPEARFTPILLRKCGR